MSGHRNMLKKSQKPCFWSVRTRFLIYMGAAAIETLDRLAHQLFFEHIRKKKTFFSLILAFMWKTFSMILRKVLKFFFGIGQDFS